LLQAHSASISYDARKDICTVISESKHHSSDVSTKMNSLPNSVTVIPNIARRSLEHGGISRVNANVCRVTVIVISSTFACIHTVARPIQAIYMECCERDQSDYLNSSRYMYVYKDYEPRSHNIHPSLYVAHQRLVHLLSYSRQDTSITNALPQPSHVPTRSPHADHNHDTVTTSQCQDMATTTK
jgi:hypothetical protein